MKWEAIKTIPFVLLLSLFPAPELRAAAWKAGVARADINPAEPIWLSGYSNRDRPAEGKLTDLWAKALVLDDGSGGRALLVTLDLIGLHRDLSLQIRGDLQKEYGLELSRIALACSHTHTGPVVGKNLESMYELEEEQWDRIHAYAAGLRKTIVRVAGEALERLAPAELSWGLGKATFAVNRRANREPDVPRLREAGKLKGPVDHDVPVLKVAAGGKVKAIVVGYACHATVLSFYRWSGDYPGFAQLELERAYPGAVAMFWAGCGADQNPLPRREVSLARDYGRQLAEAARSVLEKPMRPITGGLGAEYDEVALPFSGIPSREEIEKSSKSSNRYERGRARLLLDEIERNGKLRSTYPYPVQTLRLGSEIIFVLLGGEVVVDYSLRLKRELRPGRTWVAGYTNDVMAYIPSRRVLTEGGYEGASAMVYYGQPATWAPEVEEKIVGTVQKQVKRLLGEKG